MVLRALNLYVMIKFYFVSYFHVCLFHFFWSVTGPLISPDELLANVRVTPISVYLIFLLLCNIQIRSSVKHQQAFSRWSGFPVRWHKYNNFPFTNSPYTHFCVTGSLSRISPQRFIIEIYLQKFHRHITPGFIWVTVAFFDKYLWHFAHGLDVTASPLGHTEMSFKN